LVARLFGRLPLIHIDPDRTVALGERIGDRPLDGRTKPAQERG
jgi:hypothetical protein